MERAQLNVRFEPDQLAALDILAAAEGRSRADIVRDAVVDRLRAATAARVSAAYERAYRDQPETDEELDRAVNSAQRLTSEETWERWW